MSSRDSKAAENPYESIVSLDLLTSNAADGGTTVVGRPIVPVDPGKRHRVKSAPFLRMYRPSSGGSQYSRITKRQEKWAQDPMKPHPHHYDSPENTVTISSWHSSKTYSSAIAMQYPEGASSVNGDSVASGGNNSAVVPRVDENPAAFFAHRISKFLNPFMQHSAQKGSKLKPGQEDHIYLGDMTVNTNPLFGGHLFVVAKERNIFDALQEIEVCITINKPLIPSEIKDKLGLLRINLVSAENMPCKKPFSDQQKQYEPVYLSFTLMGETFRTGFTGKPHAAKLLFNEEFYLISSWLPKDQLVSTLTDQQSFLSVQVHDRDPKKKTGKSGAYGVSSFTLDKSWDDLKRDGKVKLESAILCHSKDCKLK